MVNVLMLSKWHVHAEEYANTVNAQPDAQVTCVWDDDVARGEAWAKELGIAFEPDLNKALARADVDAVVVDTPTTDHPGIIIAAANAGKHIFTEKTLATTVEDCKAIAEAVKKNNVKFCISYPHLITPFAQYCKQLVDAGELGKIHYMRFRNAHQGTLAGWLPEYWYDVEKTGGGAMMDLGCHPMYYAPFLLGKPKRVASIFNTTYAPAPNDDNAVSVVEFENNAIAVLETSFISPYDANCFELLGTEGAVVRIGDQIKVRTKDRQDDWFTPDNLPEAMPVPIRLWLNGIINGDDILFDLEKAIQLGEMLENAYRSHNEQKIVTIR